MAQRIVLASDFGKAARHAATDAAMLARVLDASIHVVHVHERLPSDPQRERLLSEHIRKNLAKIERSLAVLGVASVESHLGMGSAAEAILHLADSLGAEWIVLGAQNRSAISPITGVTAETVARFATQRVWIARGRQAEQLGEIVCGVDASECSRQALTVARDLCTELGARLWVVHASEPLELLGDDSHAAASSELRDAERTTRELVETVLGETPRELLTVRRGRADHVLRDFVESHSADLLVLGRTGPGGLRRVFLGATAERLLRGVPCSLLLTSPAPRHVGPEQTS